tara:strand:+ start:61 stop:792 length:732 start_codon:yes stop_codon:yes gene_type:complete
MAIPKFIEAISAKGGMSYSNSFKIKIRPSFGVDSASESPQYENYAGSGVPWYIFMCDEAQLPNVQAASGTLKGRYLGEGQVNYPHTRVFTEFQLGFQCDADMTPLKYLNQWFGKIWNEVPRDDYGDPDIRTIFSEETPYQRNTVLSYPKDYCRDIIVTKTESGRTGSAGRPSISYVLERAWPFAIDAVPLQFGTAQLTKVTAQFYYTRHHIINSDITEPEIGLDPFYDYDFDDPNNPSPNRGK